MPILIIISDLEKPQDCCSSDASVEYTNPAARELILARMKKEEIKPLDIGRGQRLGGGGLSGPQIPSEGHQSGSKGLRNPKRASEVLKGA